MDARRRGWSLGDKLRRCPEADHVMTQLAHCAALKMPEAMRWCEELGIEVRQVDPIGLVSPRALEKWAAGCVMRKAAYMDVVCRMLLSDNESMQSSGWDVIEWMAQEGDALGLVLHHVRGGVYASNILKRDLLAREHVWPEVVAALR